MKTLADIQTEMNLPEGETVIYHCPANDSAPMNDTPSEYAVVVHKNQQVPGGCIIYGKHRGEWMANVSARWLVLHLIRSLNRIKWPSSSLWRDPVISKPLKFGVAKKD